MDNAGLENATHTHDVLAFPVLRFPFPRFQSPPPDNHQSTDAVQGAESTLPQRSRRPTITFPASERQCLSAGASLRGARV